MAKGYKFRTLGEYQRLLDQHEKCNDPLILPGLFLVVRLDARRHELGWERFVDGDYPYNEEITNAFHHTGKELFSVGYRSLFAVAHGDEVSLLLHPSESSNARRRSMLLTVLSSAASLAFRRACGAEVLFHAVLSELPGPEYVYDYFFWQRRVYRRNYYSRILGLALSETMPMDEANKKLARLSEDERFALADELKLPHRTAHSRYLLGSGVWLSAGGEVTESLELPGTDENFLSFLESLLVEDDPAPRTTRRSSPPTPPHSPAAPFRLRHRGR